MAKLSFMIGKGGVGKTTVSAAYAVRAAVRHPRRNVLLISTDPAHSLADVFDVRLGNSARPVSLPTGRVHLWQISAQKEFDKFIGRSRSAILEVVEQGTIFSRDEIDPLLDTTIPGMAEVAALLAIDALLESGNYDEIVADTAPVGHTLRLFEMPSYFLRFLDFLDIAASRDRVLAAHFGGNPAVAAPSQRFLGEWRRAVEHVQQALSAEHSRVVLVTTPESFALNESMRAADALAGMGRQISSIILNRAVVQPGACPRCGKRARDTRSAQAFLTRHFPRVPVSIAEDSGSPPIGITDLRAFGEHVFGSRRLSLRSAPPGGRTQLRFKQVAWPELATPLSLTVGKGGVGKTTLSAALAFHQRATKSRQALTICSTDPAPSLDDVFKAQIGDSPTPVLGDPGLRALELDSVAEFQRWSREMKSKLGQAMSSEIAGLHVDLSFDRQVISALLDVVPPGVDEVFAIFRILDLLPAGPGKLIIDMAPTGHALELLRMPARMQLWTRLLLKSLAAHRTLPLAQDVAVEIASVGQRIRELVSMLQDSRRSRIWPVMLAEPLPDHETERLLGDLAEIGVHAAPLFVNRVVFAENAARCLRCRRQHGWQMVTLARLRRRGRALYVARNFPDEISGAQQLKKFTAELWQIA